jgi:hypothetical protein
MCYLNFKSEAKKNPNSEKFGLSLLAILSIPPFYRLSIIQKSRYLHHWIPFITLMK